MATDDWLPPLNFRELNLLPRVIFALGAVLFVAAVIHRDLELKLFGAGTVFIAVAFNFFIVIFEIGYEEREEDRRQTNPATRKNPYRKLGLAFDLLVAAALGIGCLYLSAHLWQCGNPLSILNP